jgi:hypothetical protein
MDWIVGPIGMTTLTLLVRDESSPCRVAQSDGHADLASEGHYVL